MDLIDRISKCSHTMLNMKYENEKYNFNLHFEIKAIGAVLVLAVLPVLFAARMLVSCV